MAIALQWNRQCGDPLKDYFYQWQWIESGVAASASDTLLIVMRIVAPL